MPKKRRAATAPNQKLRKKGDPNHETSHSCFIRRSIASGAYLRQSGIVSRKIVGQLKTLAGSWTGTNSAGEPLAVSFRETSAGSALLNEVHDGNADAEDMISMFHLDGSRLMLTHYCTAGNQPRMVGHASPDGRTITFDFLDATNLPNQEAGHMWRVVIFVLDSNHHTETWVYLDQGKKTTEVYDLRRATPAASQAGQK